MPTTARDVRHRQTAAGGRNPTDRDKTLPPVVAGCSISAPATLRYSLLQLFTAAAVDFSLVARFLFSSLLEVQNRLLIILFGFFTVGLVAHKNVLLILKILLQNDCLQCFDTVG